ELIAAGQVAPAAGGLAEALIRLLERFGAAAAVGAEWRLEETNDLPEAEEVWRLLLADAPDLVGELALIASAVEDLPRTLTGGPREDGATSAFVEHLLHASPAS